MVPGGIRRRASRCATGPASSLSDSVSPGRVGDLAARSRILRRFPRRMIVCGTGARVWVAGERSRRGGTTGGWGQGMRAARRPQGAVGLGAVDLLAERAMRSGRRIGLVVGCLAGGEQRVVGYGRLRTDAQDPLDGGTIFEIGSVTKVFTGLLLAEV